MLEAITGHIREDAMNRSILESVVAHRSRAENAAGAAPDCFAELISDDDIPWGEIMADFSSPGGHPDSPTCGHLKFPHP